MVIRVKTKRNSRGGNIYSHAETQRAQSFAQSDMFLRQHGVLGVFSALILCVLHEWLANDYSAQHSAHSAPLRDNKNPPLREYNQS